MNETRTNLSYAAIVTERRDADAVQRTLANLEQSGRDLRNVTLEEFKALLSHNIRQRAAQTEHLVGC